MSRKIEKRNPQTSTPKERWTRLYREVLTEHFIWPMVVLMVLIGAGVPGFLTAGNWLNVLWGAASLGCLALGLYFVLMTGRMDLSIESTLVFAPTIAVLFMNNWIPGLNPLFGILIALGVGALVGLFVGVLSNYANVNPFLVTLGLLLALRGLVVFLIPEGVYDVSEGFTALGRTRLGEGDIKVPVAAIVIILIFVLAYLVMRYTFFGKAISAIGNNEQATRVAGVNVNFIVVSVFVVAGVLAALGGIIEVGRLNSVDASMGEGRILLVFAAVALGGTALTGGRGRVTGVFGAVIVLSGITNLMNLVGFPTALQQVMFGVILLSAILLSSLQDSLRKRWNK